MSQEREQARQVQQIIRRQHKTTESWLTCREAGDARGDLPGICGSRGSQGNQVGRGSGQGCLLA